MNDVEKVRGYLKNLKRKNALPRWCREHYKMHGVIVNTAYRIANGENVGVNTLRPYHEAMMEDLSTKEGR